MARLLDLPLDETLATLAPVARRLAIVDSTGSLASSCAASAPLLAQHTQHVLAAARNDTRRGAGVG